MAELGDVTQVEAALEALAAREPQPLVAKLAREPGRRESRYTHLLSGAAAAPAAPAPGHATGPSYEERLARLEREVEALRADLSSQQQIRALAALVRARCPRLDVLVNNAGGIWLDRQLTVDGREMTFAVNHLAYFLLTQLLLDVLQAATPARVVNVAPAAHRKAWLDFDDLQGERHYSGWRVYCRSKLANLLFTYELARRLAGTGVTANALHPGWVATGFGANNGWRGRLLQLVARCFALGPEKGARTVVYLAASPEVAGTSGGYSVRGRPAASSAASHDQAAARRLWEVSEELTSGGRGVC